MSAAEKQTPQLQAALFYAAQGWSVVPAHRCIRQPDGTLACSCAAGAACVSKGKHPAVGWTLFQKERASDAQIMAWFNGQYADHGVGIITGAISGFFAVDIDQGPGKEGGETIANLQLIHDDLPHTIEALTGGGGRHVLLRHPGDGRYVPTAKNVLGPGVDVRGDGGFIVAAPSFHESGRKYLWAQHHHPRTTTIADSPEWVLDMVCGEAGPTAAGGTRAAPTGSGEIIKDEWGKVTDGRERHMIGIICGVIASYLRTHGALPTPDDVQAEAWPVYERTTRARGTSLDADNRGQALMRQRIGHMLRRAASGKWKVSVAPPHYEPLPANVDPETGEILPDKPDNQPDKPKRPARPLILSLAELDALPPPEWLVKDLIPAEGFVVPYGPPKAGKTFIMLSAALHVSAGRPWFGREVRQGAVIYIAGEGTGGLSLRLRAMRQHYDIPADVPFWIIPRAVNFQNHEEVKTLAALIRSTAGTVPVAMVFLDTLARSMPGADENSAQEVGLVIANCDWLRDDLRCTVLPIHHSGKDAEKGARGTSALRGAWDAAFEITSRGKSVTLKVADQKDGESGAVMNFDMIDVAVGLRTTLVPALRTEPDKQPDTSDVRQAEPSGLTGVALRSLGDILAGPEGALLPPLSDLPPNTRGTRVDVWRRVFYSLLPARTTEARQKAFVRAVDTLQQRRLVGVRDPWVWLVRD